MATARWWLHSLRIAVDVCVQGARRHGVDAAELGVEEVERVVAQLTVVEQAHGEDPGDPMGDGDRRAHVGQVQQELVVAAEQVEAVTGAVAGVREARLRGRQARASVFRRFVQGIVSGANSARREGRQRPSALSTSRPGA
jgi:hypothetical protein